MSGSDGNTSELYMGDCTRLESTGGMPEIGQRITWKGTLASGDRRKFNIQAATCW